CHPRLGGKLRMDPRKITLLLVFRDSFVAVAATRLVSKRLVPRSGARIRFAYGHEAAAGVLRGGRAALVLARGRAARRHAARCEPPGSRAREAARDAAPRSLRAPCRADRGGAPLLPRRATAACARGGDRRRARRQGGGRPERHARDRRVDGPGRRALATAPLRVREGEPRGLDRAHGVRHTAHRRPSRRALARDRHRRCGAAPSRRRVRAVLPRLARARLPGRPSLRRPADQHRGAARRDAHPHAGGRRRARRGRGRAARARRAAQGHGRPSRARAAGVGRERRSRGVRRGVHLAHVDRGGPRGRPPHRVARDRSRCRARDLGRPGRRPFRDACSERLPRLRARTARVIVRFGLGELPGVLQAVGIERPYVIASDRWRRLDVPHTAWLAEVPSATVVVPSEADGILAIGGGSAIDTAKFASAQSGRPVVHVPTTYSGAEWTTFYGVRSPDRIMRGGGAGANPVAIVYDVDLTLDLPADVTAGTSLNALAHCAEALYVAGRSPAGDEQALAGAPLIADALPRVLAEPTNRNARETLLRGAMHAGHALGFAGL